MSAPEKQPEFHSVNGSVDATVNAPLLWGDRGLAFGDGVFETMRVLSGEVPLWHYHRERLLNGLQALSIEIPQQRLSEAFAQLRTHLQSSARASGVAKLIVTRGSTGGGYQYPDGLQANVMLSFEPQSVSAPRSVHLMKCDTPVYENATLAGLKHLCRLENVLARQEVESCGYGDGVLVDGDDNVVETINSNLFFVTHQGALVTPLIGGEGVKAGVNGVVRRWIIEQYAASQNVAVTQRNVSWGEIPEFRGAFKCNGILGAIEVCSIACVRFESMAGVIDLELLNEQLWSQKMAILEFDWS